MEDICFICKKRLFTNYFWDEEGHLCSECRRKKFEYFEKGIASYEIENLTLSTSVKKIVNALMSLQCRIENLEKKDKL